MFFFLFAWKSFEHENCTRVQYIVNSKYNILTYGLLNNISNIKYNVVKYFSCSFLYLRLILACNTTKMIYHYTIVIICSYVFLFDGGSWPVTYSCIFKVLIFFSFWSTYINIQTDGCLNELSVDEKQFCHPSIELLVRGRPATTQA
jgi:hypothetical protein